jgi:cytoskeleton protein RodZ
MNDRTQADAGHSAGSMLRTAREKQGLHIAALAAAIKVAPRKLDALENDRWDELPDAAFTRALAQTVCRTLKMDPVPVMALLPSTDPGLLDSVSGTLNTPFSRRSGRTDAGGAAAVRPMVLGGVLLLVAAVAVSMLPAGFWQGGDRASTPASQAGLPAPVVATASAAVDAASAALRAAAEAASAAASSAVADGGAAVAAAATPETATPAASGAAAQASAAMATAKPAVPADQGAATALAGTGPVKLRAVQATWVSARDVNGTVLLSRLLEPGEAVAVDGAMPLRLTIGNAAGTELDFRGQKIDLLSRTKDNVARLELQ